MVMGMGDFNNEVCVFLIFERQSVESNSKSSNMTTNEYICMTKI